MSSGFPVSGIFVLRSQQMANAEDPGCRDAALATSLLLGIGMAFLWSGFALVNQETCQGACEFWALAMLYAGGPIGAVIGFFTDTTIVAWPLEIMLWVVLGFWAARMGSSRERSTWFFVMTILAAAAGFGLILSQFVELA